MFLTSTLESRRACYLVCPDASCSEAVARGLASLLPEPVRLFFEGDRFLPGAGKVLVDSLLSGETVVVDLPRRDTGL